ncbi:hypothetical protein FACS189496_5310 [Bacilli bacterium]|nr:hypothetical protein FACS189496_5310 [Bacilli bacterium]
MMDNFFFNSLAKTATGAKDSLQDITLNTSDSYSGGVNDYKGTDLNDKYSQIGTKGLSLFNSASTNEDLNK